MLFHFAKRQGVFQFYDLMINLRERTFISRISKTKFCLNHNNGCPWIHFSRSACATLPLCSISSIWGGYHTYVANFHLILKLKHFFNIYICLFLFMFSYSFDKYCLFILQLFCFPYVYLFAWDVFFHRR